MQKTMIAMTAGLLLAATSGSGFGATAAEPAACKTMHDETGCKGRTDCVWVPEHSVKKSGKEVAAYCRAKGAQKAQTTKPQTAPATKSQSAPKT